jgi:hypothetical protein
MVLCFLYTACAASSSAKVASCTSRSAPWAAATRLSQGRVSPAGGAGRGRRAVGQGVAVGLQTGRQRTRAAAAAGELSRDHCTAAGQLLWRGQAGRWPGGRWPGGQVASPEKTSFQPSAPTTLMPQACAMCCTGKGQNSRRPSCCLAACGGGGSQAEPQVTRPMNCPCRARPSALSPQPSALSPQPQPSALSLSPQPSASALSPQPSACTSNISRMWAGGVRWLG